jgi:hypothetical protein
VRTKQNHFEIMPPWSFAYKAQYTHTARLQTCLISPWNWDGCSLKCTMRSTGGEEATPGSGLLLQTPFLAFPPPTPQPYPTRFITGGITAWSYLPSRTRGSGPGPYLATDDELPGGLLLDEHGLPNRAHGGQVHVSSSLRLGLPGNAIVLICQYTEHR